MKSSVRRAATAMMGDFQQVCRERRSLLISKECLRFLLNVPGQENPCSGNGQPVNDRAVVYGRAFEIQPWHERPMRAPILSSSGVAGRMSAGI